VTFRILGTGDQQRKCQIYWGFRIPEDGKGGGKGNTARGEDYTPGETPPPRRKDSPRGNRKEVV